MAKLSTIKIELAEPGMKLAVPVVSAAGQTLLKSGTLLEETHIDFLKRRGIRTLQVSDVEFAKSDSEMLKKTLDRIEAMPTDVTAMIDEVDVSTIDPGGPAVVLDRMPAETPPKEAPTHRDVMMEQLDKTRKDWKEKRADRKKKLEQKHGETYKKMDDALGDPKPLTKDVVFHPANLFSAAVRDVTEQIYLEKKLTPDTLDILTKNITMEILSRQGLSTLLSRAQAAGQYLMAHMVNVGVFSMYLAIQMELSSQEVQDTAMGGLLSDIGMLAMPERYWVLDRELWQKEQSQIRRHPEESRKLILATPGTRELWARIAGQHHERLDGSGYPQGLKGKDIDLSARIVQICDVYAASTADRAFRDAHFPDDAMRQLMGKQNLYDRSIVEIFCQLVGFFPEGYLVLLSSGEHAVVVSTNPKNVFRPVVRLRKDKNGRPLMASEQHVLDLSGRLDLRIVKILEDDSVRWV